MHINIDKLSDEEKQALVDDLHNAKVFPTRLIGAGSAAHIEAINANLNDLRQMVAVEANNVSKFFEVLGMRQQAVPKRTAHIDPDKEQASDLQLKESGNESDKDTADT